MSTEQPPHIEGDRVTPSALVVGVSPQDTVRKTVNAAREASHQAWVSAGVTVAGVAIAVTAGSGGWIVAGIAALLTAHRIRSATLYRRGAARLQQALDSGSRKNGSR